MYHHVNPHRGDTVTVTPDVFEGQMRYLAETGYRTLNVDELLSYMKGELSLRQKAVTVTFDDGWLDNYIYAFPVMKRYGIHAAFFIVTDRVDGASGHPVLNRHSVPSHGESKGLIDKGEAQEVVLGWELITEMAGSGLAGFYSHTKTHRKCDSLTAEELLQELGHSKKVVEKRLGRKCPYFCWPFGKYTDVSVEAARELGYRALFTTDHGVAKVGSDPFSIKRIVVKDGISWFKRKMTIYTNPVLSSLYLKIRKK